MSQPATVRSEDLPAMQATASSGDRSVLSAPAISVAIAGGVAGCLLASGIEGPLPTLALAAALLFFVVESDLRERRIPNWITLPALLAALAWHGLAGEGLLFALGGALLGLGLLLPPYALGLLGAGDVKAVMALGALWGTATTAVLLVWCGLVGGVFGAVVLALNGGGVSMARRWWHSLGASFAFRRAVYFPPEPGSVAARGLPFGLVLGLGALATCRWGALWA